HRAASLDNSEVRVETKNFVSQLFVKTAHHANDDDEHRDAQSDSQHGNQSDDRYKGPFGPQIPEGKQQFERQPRHGGTLKGTEEGVNLSTKGCVMTSRGIFVFSRADEIVTFAAWKCFIEF